MPVPCWAWTPARQVTAANEIVGRQAQRARGRKARRRKAAGRPAERRCCACRKTSRATSRAWRSTCRPADGAQVEIRVKKRTQRGEQGEIAIRFDSLDELNGVLWRSTSPSASATPLAYATAAERMLKAIGEPQMIDTRNDPRLSRIFANKVIKIYPAFAEFYGMEDAIEQVVSYFRHAAQGLEEKKQILYLLGPGGWRQEFHRRAPEALLMQEVPFYAIKGSPVNESPLGLFDPGRGWSHPGEGIRHPAAATSTAS
jgi:hypothetical protein